MLDFRPFHTSCERKLKPRVPVAFLKKAADNRLRARLPSMLIQQVMKFGVQLAPAPNVLSSKFRAVFLKDLT